MSIARQHSSLDKITKVLKQSGVSHTFEINTTLRSFKCEPKLKWIQFYCSNVGIVHHSSSLNLILLTFIQREQQELSEKYQTL